MSTEKDNSDDSSTSNTSETSDVVVLNKQSKRKSFWAILFAVWLVFIILSQIPFLAEDITDTSKMEEEYEYHLSFLQDGKQGHYYVERYDTERTGRIHVVYTTASNSLEVECTNIKVLKIYCREMYEKKSEEVLKRDPDLDSNYYKTYFITRDHFHVHVFTEKMITDLEFIDTPIPYNVTVNGQEWWLTRINYTYNCDGIVLTKVPAGHTKVDIYFQSKNQNSPVAQFVTDKSIVGVNEDISFDARSSYDTDGQIISYAWDFGEGSFKGGIFTKHSFGEKGAYQVILTVTDDDYLIGRAYREIVVVDRVMNISIDVDKPIATPGSILTYTITPVIDTNWLSGVKELVVIDRLPAELKYADASPLPQINDKNVTWKLGIAFDNNELPLITLKTTIVEDVVNNTVISNFVTLDYNGIDDQQFPQEQSNSVETRIKVGSILAPRIKMPVANIELLEDSPPFDLVLNSYEYDFQDFGTDLDWYVTGENVSLYMLSGEYSDDDIITITPLPNAYGNNLVTLWLVDSEGYSANQPLWINITPVNDNPIFSTAPDLIIHYNEPYKFDYESYLFDIDTPKEQLQLFATEKGATGNEGAEVNEGTGGSKDAHFHIEGLKVTYNFPEEYLGKEVYVSLIVFDGNGSDGDTIKIEITSDYTPRVIKELPDVWLFEGETKFNVFDIDDYFEDPDGDSLFYSFGETHVSVTINENHTVDISSLTDWNGVDTITFRARDPIGAIAEDSIYVIVKPINDAPVISGVPDTFTVHYDADYSFDLSPYITDNDNTHGELYLILDDEYIRTDPINNLKIIMNYPESMVGKEIPVTLTVSDGIGTDFQIVTVKVTDNWPPELISELFDISFFEDEKLINAFNLNSYFTDKDSNTLYYSYGQKFVNITINSDGNVDFSALKDWNGVEIVTFRATDSTNAFVESVITVTVIPVNDPPTVKDLPTIFGTEKQLSKFDLTEFIFDIDNDISELIISVNANKLDITISGRELLIYSKEPIIEEITITISDGHLETSKSMMVEIQDDGIGSPVKDNSEIFLLWILIIIILIIILISGFAAYRKYVGDYGVEEIFCISNNGILISHATLKRSKHRADEFVVSGMLTAIISFTQDAFNEDEKGSSAWGIKEIQMNEKNILIDKGEHLFLATVFNGRSGKKLYSHSRKILLNIEIKYKKQLKTWDGNLGTLAGVKNFIETLLPEKAEIQNHHERK